MVMEKPPEVNPPSSSVPGRVLLAIPRSESLQRWNSGRNRVTGLSSRVSVSRAKYMPKAGLRGGPLAQAARGRGHPPGRAEEAPGQGVAPLGAPFGLLQYSFVDIFLVFFWNFPSTFIFVLFLQCRDNNRRKLALGTGLVG